MTTSTLIANFRAAADEIEARLAPSCLRHDRFAQLDRYRRLRTPDFHAAPEGGKHRATCTGHGRAHKVNRFTKADAEYLAQACNARAAFWADAAREEAAALRSHIATLEALSAA